MMDFIMVPAVMTIITLGVYKLFELFVCKKERIMRLHFSGKIFFLPKICNQPNKLASNRQNERRRETYHPAHLEGRDCSLRAFSQHIRPAGIHPGGPYRLQPGRCRRTDPRCLPESLPASLVFQGHQFFFDVDLFDCI